ncbi:hypothetical protein GQ42DRAFT_155178 [Ramicandelaber brevisporus]|nr:hypothetical protein GQ42DRAFT_155178 [Ramicandelaber brevisporus]
MFSRLPVLLAATLLLSAVTMTRWLASASLTLNSPKGPLTAPTHNFYGDWNTTDDKFDAVIVPLSLGPGCTPIIPQSTTLKPLIDRIGSTATGSILFTALTSQLKVNATMTSQQGYVPWSQQPQNLHYNQANQPYLQLEYKQLSHENKHQYQLPGGSESTRELRADFAQQDPNTVNDSNGNGGPMLEYEYQEIPLVNMPPSVASGNHHQQQQQQQNQHQPHVGLQSVPGLMNNSSQQFGQQQQHHDQGFSPLASQNGAASSKNTFGPMIV